VRVGGPTSPPTRHRVVVVGGGFGGLQAVRKLRRADVDVTLIDRRNFHLFQPLLYQVATGALSAGEIASPLRAVFQRNENVRVLLGNVTGFDLDARTVTVGNLPNGSERAVPYDTLIVSAGSRYSYFGHDDWRPLAPDLKSVEDAIEIRRRILLAFEAAEVEPDAGRRAAWLTFVVVGGGPTGVELAGQIAELARDTLPREFRDIDTRGSTIVLVELADRVLTSFPPRLSARASRALERLGVKLQLGHTLVGIDEESVTTTAASGERERLPARTVLWAAGVVASDLARKLADASGAGVDRAGRVAVEPDLTLPGHPEVFAIGDMVQIRGAAPLPGVAPVAMQQGRHAGGAVEARLRGNEPKPFRYKDKGNLATIGRAKAVAHVKGLQLSGLLAWVAWLFVHLFYLIGLQNRILVFTRWTFSFLTHGRGARLITGRDQR
jgi:NADH dehydrogenase